MMLRDAANLKIRESDDCLALQSAATTYFYHSRCTDETSTEQAAEKAARLAHDILDGNYANLPSGLLMAPESEVASSSTTTQRRTPTNWRRARNVVPVIEPDTEPTTPVVRRVECKDLEPAGWVDYGKTPAAWVDYGNWWSKDPVPAETTMTWAQKAMVVAPCDTPPPRAHVIARCVPMYVQPRPVNIDIMSIPELQRHYKFTQVARMLGSYDNWVEWASVYDVYDESADTRSLRLAYPGLVMHPVALIDALSANSCWCTAETAIRILFDGEMDYIMTPDDAGNLLWRMSWTAHSELYVHDNGVPIKPAWNVYVNKQGMWTVHMHAITVRNYFKPKSNIIEFNLPQKYVPDDIKGKR
jgi:hypothetical protein